ncbi:peptide deformylase [Cloacibacillus sp. An23]|uniref:peptide deformylase n=1 Tax=Cloacibacillus sp. An23 TaxID=1965591 RepID=UPI000B3A1F16|nr:peptide deformylase [Cloacibacillus sp. An23]OUO91900.1 peptide deformylase [Cloacibacillus sp. An23]
MALRTICVYPNPVLREETEEVTVFDGELKTLVADMWDTMYANDGIGLAAPQVGVSKKVIVIDYKDDKYVLVNPKVLSAEGSVVNEEGCLSFPGIYEKVESPERMTVEYADENGETVTRELEGFIACVFSHEIDHLNGRLLIDRVSPLKRQFMKKKIARRASEEK